VNRHNSDIVSLVAGLIFLGVAGMWALGRIDLLPGSRGWLLPLVLVAAGVAGLLTARPRRSDTAETTGDTTGETTGDTTGDTTGETTDATSEHRGEPA
jgi:hypothetical protein